jgi:general bacterial porin, GBP family
MKKTLLAAALLTGFAGAASAQSSVTLYGVVSVGLRYQSVQAPSGDYFNNRGELKSSMSRFDMESGQQNGSRWGLKGVEDLGNGLKASFVYESGVTVTTGASTGFTRQATVALNGSSWGGLQLGRAVSPGTLAFAGIDPFGYSFGTASLTSSQGNTFIRYSNMIQYATPSMSGFKGWLGYSFNPVLASNSSPDGFETNNKNRVLSLGLRYANGPLLLSGIFDNAYSNSLNTGEFNTGNIKSWAIGGTYDFKVAKLHASYGQSIDGIMNGAAIANLESNTGPTNDNDDLIFAQGGRLQSWMLGVSAPVGAAGNVFLSFQQRITGGEFNLTEEGSSTATQSTASIGYTYNFSKRTNIYAYYSYMGNAGNIDGLNANTLGVGLVTRF